MENFKERLEKEGLELATKIEKLRDFIKDESFLTLEKSQQSLLRIQKDAMLTYWRCVRSRIDHLNDTPENINNAPSYTKVNPLAAPANYDLTVLFTELKRGRPAESQKYLDSLILELTKPKEETYKSK